MKIIILTFLLAVFCTSSAYVYSQNLSSHDRSINQHDGSGKKHGVWIEYYNSSFRTVKKEEKAVYYRYVQYQHGTCFHTSIIPKGFLKKTIIISDNINDSIHKPILLNGNYWIYDHNKRLLGKCFFDSGWLISDTSYHWNGAISSIIDYSKKYENFECSNVKYLFNENGVLYFHGYEILEDSKWRVVRIK